MLDPNNQPETLMRVGNEMEAAMIVSTLAAENIDATSTGDFTAGFRAEAPGDVSVLVRSSDLDRARKALDLTHDTVQTTRTLRQVSPIKIVLAVVLPVFIIALLISLFFEG